ncbi:MAG: PQQ-binding-like beta-propeller repeat protein, partial [Verrucomicrobiota bacterium]|nr:PQQ-binding-like beta-propeller repeat protein [Verrucomicrobiota bacterium]
MVAEKPVAAAAEPAIEEQPTQAQPETTQGKKSPVLAIAAAFIVVTALGWFFMSGSDKDNKNANLQPTGKGTGETNGNQQAGIANSLKEGLVAYYPFNGNANDESGGGLHGTLKGKGDYINNAQGKPNSAIYVDAGSYIDVPLNPVLVPDMSSFTVSLWFKTAYAGSPRQPYLICSTSLEYTIGFGGHQLYVRVKDNGKESMCTAEKYKELIKENEWAHVSLVIDRKSNVLRGYLNGEASHFSTPPELPKEAIKMLAGKGNHFVRMGAQGRYDKHYTGAIDDVRIYNRALSAEEITALYDLEKPKTDLKKGLVAYYPFNGNAKDESGNGHHGEVNGATLTADRHSKSNSAYNFNKNVIAIPTTASADYSLGHTMSVWAKVPDIEQHPARSDRIIYFVNRSLGFWINQPVNEIMRRPKGATTSEGIAWGSRLRFFTKTGQKSITGPILKTKFKPSEWFLMTSTFDNKVMKLYVNGSLAGETIVNDFEKVSFIADTPNIGSDDDYRPTYAQLDDVRIYNRALSEAEVKELYNLEKPSSETASGKKPGTLLWEFETGREVRSSPSISSDGTIYFGSFDQKVYALESKSGVKKWEFQTDSFVSSSPAIGSDGTIYIGSEDANVYALDGKTGAKLWEFQTEDRANSSPAIGSDGTVYVGSNDQKLYALDSKTGTKIWEFKTGHHVSSSPAIGSDGTVYVGSFDKKIYALDGKTGAKIWEFKTEDFISSSPAIGLDGNIYIASEDKKIYAINGKNGTKIWEFKTENRADSSPAIGSDGTVYVGSDDGKLYALNGKTGIKLWEFQTGGDTFSPAVGNDGTVYIGSIDKKLYALNGKTG